MEYELIDVTSKHRPNPTWRFMDMAGHAFRWHDSKGPARDYEPTEEYHVPGTRLITAGEASLYRLECVVCAATIEPGYTADSQPRFIRV
jgi:hypothetical protein